MRKDIKLLVLFFLILGSELKSQWVELSVVTGVIYTITQNEDGIYIGVDDFIYGGVFLSTDNGVNWNDISASLYDKRVLKLIIINNNIFAGTRDVIYRTTNNGAIWQKLFQGLPYEPTVFSILADSLDLYAGTVGYGVYKSTNLGENWFPSNTGLPSNSVTVRDFLTKDSTIFLASNKGVYKSTNKGTYWVGIPSGLPDNYYVITLVLVDSTIYAGTLEHGIFKLSADGTNWTYVNKVSTQYLMDLLVYKGTIFAATWNGVFISNNNGFSWNAINDGLTFNTANTLVIRDSSIFAGTTHGAYRRPITEILTTVEYEDIESEFEFQLSQNYPNPFNPSTIISCQIPVAGNVTLKVYDVLGREITTLVNEYRSVGIYNSEFDANNIPSGVYFYQLKAGDYLETKKMMLLK